MVENSLKKSLPAQDPAEQDGWKGKAGSRTRKVKCAGCGVEIVQTDYSSLCDTIMGHQPVCSYECNKKLGQAQ